MMDTNVEPRRSIIVSGSHIGLEVAKIYRRFGVKLRLLKSGRALLDGKMKTANERSQPGVQKRLVRAEPRERPLPGSCAYTAASPRQASL